ncbi:MAG: hypothetical protein DMG78_32405, partial [Acidobacteria bacterium]
SRPLTIEEIEEVAISFKEDLTRDCERMIRRSDMAGALSTLMGKEFIDKFLYTLKLRAGSSMGQPARARPIHIPASVKEAGKKRAKKAKKRGSKS